MRTLISTCLLFVATACVAQENADTAIHNKVNPNSGGGRSGTGTIIHIHNKSCETIIRYVDKEKKDTLLYLPVGDAIRPFDREGTVISFKYRRSLIRQPFGCIGMPIIMSDIKVISSVHHKGKKTYGAAAPAAK